MTPEQIAELRALCDKATPGPWACPPSYSGACSQQGDIAFAVPGSKNNYRNMAFIAAARTAVPELLDALEAMTRRAEVLKVVIDEDNLCAVCEHRDENSREEPCRSCDRLLGIRTDGFQLKESYIAEAEM